MTNIGIVRFNTGEVSPKVDVRSDIEDYVGGCRILQNMIPDIYGNVVRRPGTEFIVFSVTSSGVYGNGLYGSGIYGQ